MTTPGHVLPLDWVANDHTRRPWRGKPAEQCPDGPRYRAIGNSWAIPVVAWIFGRIAIMTAHQHREAVA
jgi:DNA (cytosine-5)-methyltransferase 1